VTLADFLDRRRVIVPLEARTVREATGRLARTLVKSGAVVDEARLAVLGFTLDDVARFLPNRDRVSRRRDQAAVGIKQTGAGAGGADVDANKRLLHNLCRAIFRSAHQHV